MSSGLTPKRVLVVNFLCACFAFIGLYIGIAVSSNLVTRQWIFAATAGMFLYISLVDMVNLPHPSSPLITIQHPVCRSVNIQYLVQLPELVKRESKSKLRLFLLQNIGLLVGFGSMFIIALLEHIIHF